MKTIQENNISSLSVAFRSTEKGSPVVVFEGFPKPNEGINPERIRNLAEVLYQVARFSELNSYQSLDLRY